MDRSFRFGADGENNLQVVWEDGDRVFCRGWRHGADDNLNAVLAVLPAAKHPTHHILNRLAHEYELKDELDSAWAVRPLELVQERGQTVLVLEDTGGEPLDGLLGVPMEVGNFLRLAIGIATALSKLHQRGLVHKDVKPAHILVNRASGGVWLTGFGIASRLPREQQSPEPPDNIAGTLAYMAPEQTGRMNRSIDARSDLYALGVTLYQMLTGGLPFTASDPMEWVHCHIARKPVPPGERLQDVPAPVSGIIMKLLAKTAEDRYQTAGGVERDLRRCLADWEASRRIDGFPLGEQDTPDRLLIPEKLYGRAREIDTLLAAFDRVVTSGISELVLISGYSGIGKSSVVNELHKVLVPPRGLFASGKFDQYKRDIPYSTLAQAFQSLIRSLLSKREAELGRWRDALREALGPNGQLIVSLVPDLELVIGKQPPAPDLPPQDVQHHFQMVLRRFLSVFAQKEHPLALFLDDLQWLDAATLDLLEDLVTHSEVRYLLLIGAYRDNEVDRAHPLARTLNAILNAGAQIQGIVLAPLRLDHLNRLVADALHCGPKRAHALAQLLYEKTGGNPFFAIQFLTALAEEGLLVFDSVARAWQWDLDRIRAKSYTDNVIDLMVRKLKRVSTTTLEILEQLACLGNVAEVATLTLVHAGTEDAIHRALREAVYAGLIIQQDCTYKFLHDRIRQATYSLIPEESRAEIHLKIGRLLLRTMTADRLAEHLFDIANHLDRGALLLIDRDERAEVATINLRAARKAKASAAYASACKYLEYGMALLDDTAWGSRYELIFSLWLERAECEFFTGDFEKAGQIIMTLMERAASKVDRAAVYRAKILLHALKSESVQAVDSALTCLRLFDIDFPVHPSREQVQAEYEAVWRTLNGRPIESLIDLPLMIDPEQQAAMQVLEARLVLLSPAYVTDIHSFCMHLCRMVNISMQHGTTGASAHAYGYLGYILGPMFHRYREGYSFGKLACDLAEGHGFVAYQAKVKYAMGLISVWTEPLAVSNDFMRATFDTAARTGDLHMACYGMCQLLAGLLARNDPIDAVWRELERGLDFARKSRFRDVEDIIVSQQRFVAAMQGRTATFSTFSDAHFDEAAFEAQLTGERASLMVCLYWILKLKARFLAGDYEAALAAARKADPHLWAALGHIQSLDYFYYAALTVGALYEKGSADEQIGWRDLLNAHREQLREWAENYPPTFGDKHALVSAEIARLEGRNSDAMALYEQAIQSARKHGFVQNEGTAFEVAARFYASRSLETIADSYLRSARSCYLRWGADGKVRQLEQFLPVLRETAILAGPTATFGAPAVQFEVEAVVKASQAVSGEIELRRLIETLLRIVIEHAGAARGLLILLREDGGLQVEAEATVERQTLQVTLRQEPATPLALPGSLLQTVIRTQQSVILDDALVQNAFSGDEYIRQKRARSVLCVPLMKQARLFGVLYLENNLVSHAFTPARISVLELLASQAAISLENARLYNDLQERDARIRRLVESNIIGVAVWDIQGRIIEANEAFLDIVGYDRDDFVSGGLRLTELTPSEWRDADGRAAAELQATGTLQPYEKEYFRKDGSRVPIVLGAATFGDRRDQVVAFVLDLTERKQVEEVLHNARMKLAHVNRVTGMGQFAASIAHEVSQPIAATVTNASAGLRWLGASPPNLEEVRQAFQRIIMDGKRARDIIGRVRTLARNLPPQRVPLDINETLGEVIALTRAELQRNGVSLETRQPEGLPLVQGDRVQLQQVMFNLILNAIEAMVGVSDRARELLVSTQRGPSGEVLVAVRDSGPGLDLANVDRLFEAFYTTKPGGMGMGLSICQSIIEAHGGRLWATANVPHGATFQFTLLAEAADSS